LPAAATTACATISRALRWRIGEDAVAELLTGLGADFMRPFESARGLWTPAFTLAGIGFVIAASFVRTMVPLRALTVGSNVLLLAGAVLAPDLPNVVLNLVLIPVNTYRLLEIRRLTRHVEAAAMHGDMKGLWLQPYMHSQRLPAGAVLFRQGDRADAIHLLADGELELVEIGRRQPVGEIFGEISFFAPDRRRTLTARCVTACTVMSIHEPMFKQLYFQEPKLAFQVSSLIAHRLSADVQRLRTQLDAALGPGAAAPAVPRPPAAAAGQIA
jgi:CRP/FNR family transcriptional regulator, cyclic AMP receptor protein